MPSSSSLPRCRFFLGERAVITATEQARFTLVAGDENFAANAALPKETALRQNHPDPFNPSTLIRFNIVVPGVYFYRLQAGSFSASRKLVMLK